MLTQPISCCVAPRLPAICGSATLTMVVSSTSMIAAVIRPSRMSQRVLPMRSASSSWGAGLAVGCGFSMASVVTYRPVVGRVGPEN